MLGLRCRLCGELAEQEKMPKYGFSGVAYDYAEWADASQNTPSLDEQVWLRSDSVPTVGEERIIRVTFPFCFENDEKFELLFMPALSSLNGWDEYPDEIDKSAIVGCELLEIIEADDSEAWIKVKIVSVIMLSDISEKYPPKSSELLPSRSMLREYQYTYKFDNWEYSTFTAEGDIGSWELVYTDNSGVRHLIIYAEWGFHYNYVYYGNYT